MFIRVHNGGIGRLQRRGLALALAACATGAAHAQTPDAAAEIRAQIEALRAEQARITALQQATEASLRALEARLGVLAPAAQATSRAVTPNAASAPVPSSAPAAAFDRLAWSGDLRVRAQGDYSDDDGTGRESIQLRARVGATYTLNDQVTVGGRLVTGDADDPNSSDVQLSNWDNDLDVALDLAYAQVNLGNTKLYGGKFPLPFARTDLVWDSDVNPQGLGATWKRPLDGGAALRAGALLFVVDENAGGNDSTMAGAQIGFDSAVRGGWKFDTSLGYYDYALGSLAGADAGDFRSNLRNPDGTYRSDFNLLDALLGLTWTGDNPRWPVRVLGNVVKNLGARTDADTGMGVDIAVGKVSEPGDWRVTYGYAQTEADAVLAAFSHDNIGIATNYDLHALTVDYVPMPKTQISGIWYHYKPDDPLHAGSNAPGDWLDRLRFYFLVNF